MTELKVKKPPSLQESISKINDQLVVAQAEGDTARSNVLKKILIGLERKLKEKKGSK